MRTRVVTTWRGLPPVGRLAVVAIGVVLVIVLLGTQHGNSDQPKCYTTVTNPSTGQSHTYVTPSNGGSCT